jgi:hypothetical protein
LSGGTLTGGLTISSGNFIVSPTAGDTVVNQLYPTADNTYLLGHSGRRWSGLYTVLINGGTPIHSGNYSSYALPLSGGTIGDSSLAFPLLIKGTAAQAGIILRDSSSANKAALSWDSGVGAYIYNYASGKYLSIKDDGTPTYSGSNTLIHSGNIGSQSVASANKLLTSNGASMVYQTSAGHLYVGDNIYTSADTHILGNNIRLRYGTSASYGLILNSSGNVTIGASDLASTTTKLYVDGGIRFAPRTIWGQSFDGTGNVRGPVTDVTSLRFDVNKTYGVYIKGSVYTSKATDDDVVIASPNTTMLLGGNVLIGTTTDNGYKLQIQGDGYASAGFRANTAFYTNGDYGIWNGGRYTAALTNNDIAYYANIHSFQGGNVLIGATTDNGAKLQVSGNIAIADTTGSSTTSNRLIFVRNTRTDDYWDFGLYAQSTKGLTFFQSSKGVNTDIGYLDGNGNFVANGGGAFGSDARYKNILANTTIDLATIANAPLFTYRWTDREDDKVYLGTTAQYWLDTNFRDAVNTSNPDFYHLDYGALAVGIGISVAKEVKGVKTEVEQLRDEVKQLKEKLNKYETLWHN